MLAELATVAADEAVDAVLVCGDLFDTAAPTPESERIVYRALLDFARGGARVVVIAGNHDSDRRLDAVRPLLELGAVVTRPVFAGPDTAVVEVPSRDGFETMLVATLPFLSQRWVVRAAELMGGDAAASVQLYEGRYRQLVTWLSGRFRADTINVVAAHAFVLGAETTGSERAAHLAAAYAVPATAFPPAAHYVALGHLHRPQAVAGPCPIRYAGSPLQLDFGEAGERKVAVVVEARAGTPAKVREIPLTAGRPLRIERGTLAELHARATTVEAGHAYLRVHVLEQARLGLADEVHELFPDAVDVVVESERPGVDRGARPSPSGHTPAELFSAYLADVGVDDARLPGLFAELVEEVSS